MSEVNRNKNTQKKGDTIRGCAVAEVGAFTLASPSDGSCYRVESPVAGVGAFALTSPFFEYIDFSPFQDDIFTLLIVRVKREEKVSLVILC